MVRSEDNQAKTTKPNMMGCTLLKYGESNGELLDESLHFVAIQCKGQGDYWRVASFANYGDLWWGECRLLLSMGSIRDVHDSVQISLRSTFKSNRL